MDDELDPTPQALVRCLQVLSEEAALLRLGRTFSALQDAIAICQDESDTAPSYAMLSIGADLIH